MYQKHIKQHTHLFNASHEQRTVFFLVFMGVLSLTYGLFFIVDFLPEKPTTEDDTSVISNPTVHVRPQNATATAAVDTDNAVALPAQTVSNNTVPKIQHSASLPADPNSLPLSIIFDTLGGKEVRVLNPESSSVSALDDALLRGVVRHPDSGDFVNKGTIFLLGHSSYLPNVINKNFQAFNGIQKLAWGDTIRLRSADTEYTYRVDRVYQTRATGAEVAIEQGKERLTLATCNSFATKDDRYIVEATLVSKNAL